MKKIHKIVCLIWYLLYCQSGLAQDNQRYLALVLVNIDGYDENQGVQEIERAHQLGFNAVNIAVLWDYVKIQNANNKNPWEQYDRQFKKASELGMKIGLRIWVDGWCGDDNKKPWCSNFDFNEIMTDGAGRYDYAQSGPGKRSMTSFASASSVNRMKTFVAEVIERYKKYQNEGHILYVSLATTGEQELGYPAGNGQDEGLYDYSYPMKAAYRVWLRRKYCNDLTALKQAWGKAYANLRSFNEIEPLYSFFFKFSFDGKDGNDWYNFRHIMLKRFNNEFMIAVKAANVSRPFKIINDYGSVFDQLSVRRGTMAFKDLGENTDGIKINDAPYYNHRFAMDLIRSNMPNKWCMNEAEVKNLVPNQTDEAVFATDHFQQIDQSFAQGAKWVSFFSNVKGSTIMDVLNNSGRLVNVLNTRWLLNKSDIMVVGKGNVTVKLSELLTDNGCANGNSGCKVLQRWQDESGKNGGAPITVLLEEDLLQSTFSCSESSINAEYEGKFQGIDCQKGYGWIVDKTTLGQSIKYEIEVDGKHVMTAIADSINSEIPRNYGGLRHGFSFRLPPLLSGTHAIKVKIPNSTYLISNAIKSVSCTSDGKTIQTNEVPTCIDCEGFSIYPNPTNSRIFLTFFLEEVKNITIAIVDIYGKTVYFNDTFGVAGNNDLPIDMDTFMKGTYVLTLNIGDQTYRRRVMKL